MSRGNRAHGLALLAAVALCGCIPIVVPISEDSHTADWNRQISSETSTRGDVLALLGSPSFRADGDRVFVYTAYRRGPFVGLVGAGTVTGIRPGDLELLAITFDDDGRVVTTEEVQQSFTYYGQTQMPPVCLRSGVCWFGYALLQPADGDAEAKRFLPPANGCALYIVRSTAKTEVNEQWSHRAAFLWIDGASAGALEARTYLRVELPVGLHHIDVSRGKAPSLERQCQSLDCRDGRLVYFAVSAIRKGENGYDWLLLADWEPARAQAEVQQSRRVLSPLD